MTSRLLRRIEAQIASAKSQHAVDCLFAERACYSARQGDFAGANLTISSLRKQYAEQPDAEVIVWLNLAEGLVSYFKELGPVAHDKVLRAHALSIATGLVALHALTAAWLSQMDFSRLDSTSLGLHVSEAFRLSRPDHHSARSRASLVTAQAFHLAGRWDLASPWYTRARLHATEEGDDLSVSALMHNMVSMRLDHLRQVRLTGRGEAPEAAFALVGIESSINFDKLIGTSTLEAVRPIMRARFLSLQDRTSEALEVYEQHLVAGSSTSIARLESDVLSDLSWCRLMQGDVERSKSEAMAAEASLNVGTQIDDRAATHTRLARVFRELGEAAKAEYHEALASAAWGEFALLQQAFIEQLSSLTDAEWAGAADLPR